jgi:hypothetical protein
MPLGFLTTLWLCVNDIGASASQAEKESSYTWNVLFLGY